MPHKYSHNIKAFTNEDDLSYYLLGAYITDGCVSKNGCSLTTELKSKDKDWLESIRDLVSSESNVFKANGNCYRLRINNKQIATWLVNHNCVPNKSLTVKMPQIPTKYLPDFIRGCIDGDGSIGIHKRNNGTSSKMYSVPVCYLVSASKDFIYDIRDALSKSGIHSTTQIKHTKDRVTVLKDGSRIVGKHDQYIIKFTGRYCKELLSFAYHPGHKISMDRKAKLAKTITNLD